MVTPRLTPGNPPEPLTSDATRSVVVDVLNALARISLLLVLIVAPWIFGGVQTHVQFKLYVGVVVSLGLWICAVLWESVTTGVKINRLPLTIAPAVAAVALGAYQLGEREQTSSVQANVATSEAPLMDEVSHEELTKASLIQSLKTTRTIAPASTRIEQQKLIFAVATFLLGAQLFVSRTAQAWLFGALAANGSALAFFGIAQQISWNGRLFWTVALRHGGQPFSSFVNRNNAAGYLCICLAGALGILISTLSNRRHTFKTDYAPSAPRKNVLDRLQELASSFVQSIAQLSTIQLCTIAFVILISTGIVATVSRGGWLSLATATIITSVIAGRSRGLSVVVFVGTAILLIGGLIAGTGLENRISERWNNSTSADAIAGDGRWSHWSDSLNVVRDFPLTGTGYGTYQFAYLPYQSHARIANLRFYHADNQFLEWLVEGGVIGFSLVLTTLLLLTIAAAALLKTRDLRDPVGLVGVFVLISQCVSACFDFGPSIPSNMLGLAAMFGAITGRATMLAVQEQIMARKWLLTLPMIRPSMIAPLLGIPLFIGGINGLREIHAASMAHRISQSLPKLDRPDDLDEEAVAEQISRLSQSMVNFAGDVDAHQALANLFIYKFRLEEFAIGKQNYPAAKSSDLWDSTDPSILYRQANFWARAGQFERIESAIESPSVRANLVPAYEQLMKAQACCPLAPDIDKDLAMLAFIKDPTHSDGEDHLRRALLLAPTSSLVCYQIGMLADSSELRQLSYSCFKRSLELSPIYLVLIHRIVSKTLSLDEELEDVLPDSAELLVQLAGTYPQKEQTATREILVNRALKSLSTPREGPDEGDRRHCLARARLVLGEQKQAIKDYQEALTLVPKQTSWRMELIRLIDSSVGPLQALREAEIGVAIEPDQKQLQDLVRELRAKVASQLNQPVSGSKSRHP